VQRFRGGLVSKAHGLCVSLNSRLECSKEEGEKGCRQISNCARSQQDICLASIDGYKVAGGLITCVSPIAVAGGRRGEAIGARSHSSAAAGGACHAPGLPLCVYTYIFIYLYMYMYMHMYIYIYRYISLYIHIYIYILHIYTCVCISLSLYIHIYIYIYIYICTCIYVAFRGVSEEGKQAELRDVQALEALTTLQVCPDSEIESPKLKS